MYIKLTIYSASNYQCIEIMKHKNISIYILNRLCFICNLIFFLVNNILNYKENEPLYGQIYSKLFSNHGVVVV